MAKRIVHKHTLVKCKQVRADQIEFGEIAIQAHEYGPYLQVKDRLQTGARMACDVILSTKRV